MAPTLWSQNSLLFYWRHYLQYRPFPFSVQQCIMDGRRFIMDTDAGNNTAMEPYRAFIADKLDATQQPTGFQAQSFFTGFGQTLANVSLFIFPLIFIGKTGKLPTWVFASFFLGAVCSIVSIWWSVRTTPEIVPDESELAAIREKNKGMPHPAIQFFLSILTTLVAYVVIVLLLIPSLFMPGLIRRLLNYVEGHSTLRILFAQNIEIIDAITKMPKVMWQLALVYLFQWYALFCYWQNSSKSIALSVWNTTPNKTVNCMRKQLAGRVS